MPRGILSRRDGNVARHNGRTVFVVDARVLKKDISGSRHLLKQPPAIAVDADEYDSRRWAFDSLEIFDKETSVTYSISVESFDRYRKELDRGFGRQYYVVLGRWRKQDPHQLALAIGNE